MANQFHEHFGIDDDDVNVERQAPAAPLTDPTRRPIRRPGRRNAVVDVHGQRNAIVDALLGESVGYNTELYEVD